MSSFRRLTDILQVIAANKKKINLLFLYGFFSIGTVYTQYDGTDGYITWEITDRLLIISGEETFQNYANIIPASGKNKNN